MAQAHQFDPEGPHEVYLSIRQQWEPFDYELLIAGYLRPRSEDCEMMQAHVLFDEPGSRFRRLPPTLQIKHAAVQHLFDELWGLGFRPTRESPVENEMGVIRRHLEDMRQIAFYKLKVDKP